MSWSENEDKTDLLPCRCLVAALHRFFYSHESALNLSAVRRCGKQAEVASAGGSAGVGAGGLQAGRVIRRNASL
jgi:hypothetical protein